MPRTKTDQELIDADRDLYSGLIRLHVMHHASEEPIFGLGMMEELGRHGYRISPGSLYPLLHGLEKKGYLTSREKRNGKSLRKVYRATPLGKESAEGRAKQSAGAASGTDRGRMTRLLAVLMTAVSLSAQAQMTLSEAVDSAVRNYPSVRVSQEQINAAAAGIQLARTAYLPRVDAIAQVNRATRNNVFGMLLPQSVIPSMSGPVIGSNNFGTAWGSAMGVLVTWEPFDFGLRKASVDASAAARAESEAALKKTQFDVSVAAADAYVTLVAAQETVRAAQAGVDRAEAISRTIHALVNAELRPGADASRVDAEAGGGANVD